MIVGMLEIQIYIEKDKIPSKDGWVIFLVFGWNPNPQLTDPARRSVMLHLQQRHNKNKKKKKDKKRTPLKTQKRLIYFCHS